MTDPAVSFEPHRHGWLQSVAFEIEDGLIRAIYSVSNPDKLSHITPSA